MFDTAKQFLFEIADNLRLADFIDILLVSAFLYTIINILRKSVSRKLLITIAIFIGIYIISRLLGMYLTEMFIRILIIFISLAAIVVFQPDIRRMVDSLSRWVLSRHLKRMDNPVLFIDIVTESASKMAEIRMGALIVIKGREDLDSCINGGIALDGAVSKPLLLSIFNTKSPGHDGAVIIDNGNIVKFGAHLTLSTNIEELNGKGTRHAAGLGLSECTDAFIIIVSEERGSITIAENGKLNTLASTSELKNLMEKFWDKNYVKQKETPALFFKQLHIKTALISFALAVTGWIMFAYQSGTVYKSYDVPVEFHNMRPELELKDPIPANARITLTGSEQAFRLLDPVDLSVSVDLNRVNKGSNEILITNDNLKLPSGIKLYNIEPHTLKISAEKLRSVDVPVQIQTSGKLHKHLKLRAIASTPNRITIRVPETTSYIPARILTEPVNLNNITSSSILKSRIIIPKNAKLLPEQDPEVSIELKVAD